MINNANKEKNPKFEIYDLENDPGETKNIAAETPELQKEFMGIAAEAYKPSKEFPFPLLDN